MSWLFFVIVLVVFPVWFPASLLVPFSLLSEVPSTVSVPVVDCVVVPVSVAVVLPETFSVVPVVLVVSVSPSSPFVFSLVVVVSVPVCVAVLSVILLLVVLSVPAILYGGNVPEFLGQGFLSSILSFGGGDAYLSVADGMFVNSGIIEKADFYGHLVPLVNLLPGSILCKTLSGIGYLLGFEMSSGNILTGCLVALAGFVCSVMASGGVFCLVAYIYECFESLRVFRLLSRWIRPIIAGTLLTVMVSLFAQNISTGTKLGLQVFVSLGITAVIYGMNLLLLYVLKKKNGLLILCSIVVTLILGNVVLILV